LVSGAGEIKITKDGNVLLHEMQIQHPTASLIARTATAQDDVTGDGTTSSVLIIAELLKQADNYISEGLHPRIIVEGFDLAKEKALEVLEKVKIPYKANREILVQVARSSLETKLTPDLSEHLNSVIILNLFKNSQVIYIKIFFNLDYSRCSSSHTRRGQTNRYTYD
jgi:T-complex protein 1 subunit zeta